jgi:hypothetical protein
MLCRNLRSSLTVRWLLGGLLCLALLGSLAASTPSLPGRGEPTSIGLRAPEFPIAALGSAFGFRLQKQAQPVRLTLHKPVRSGAFSPTERACATLPRLKVSQGTALLPRRFLHTRHITPRAPQDSGDPLLRALSLS